MSMVRFAQLCDRCGKRSEEYSYWYDCRECMEDVCTDCIVPGTEDDEYGDAMCKKCAAENPIADVPLEPAEPVEFVHLGIGGAQ